MGFSQSKGEKKTYEELTNEEQNKLLKSFVKLNGMRIKLEDAHFHHVDLDKLLKSLTFEQIYKILQGEEIFLKFDVTKVLPSKPEKKKSKGDKDECLSDKAFASVAFDRKTHDVLKQNLFERNLKIATKFENLSFEDKNKILNSTVKFQGQEVRFNDLVYSDMELCNNLSGSEIDSMLKGKMLNFFKPIGDPPKNLENIYFVGNNELHQSSDIEYEYFEYIKDTSLDDGDKIYYTTLANNINQCGQQQKESGNGNKGGKNNESSSQKSSGNSNSQSNQNYDDGNSQSNTPSSGGDGNDKNNDKDRDDQGDKNSKKQKDGDEEEDKIYKPKGVFTLNDLTKESMKTRIILICDTYNVSQTATLLHVQFLLKNIFQGKKDDPSIPYIFYLNCKENQEEIHIRLKNITTDSIRDILYRLNILTAEKKGYHGKFEEQLLFKKYKKGDVIFLWNNIEEIDEKNGRRKVLLQIIKEIQDDEEMKVELEKPKNIQWIVSDQLHIKEREKLFNCPSYSFARFNNQKMLNNFDRKVRENEREISEDLSKELGIFEQNSTYVETFLKMSIGECKEILNAKNNESNHFLIVEKLYNNLNLKANIENMLMYLTINELVSDNSNFSKLRVINRNPKNDSAISRALIKSGAFKSFKNIHNFKIFDHVKDFIIVLYFHQNIFNSDEKFNVEYEFKEVGLRLQLLFYAIEKYPNVRLTLRDYLLTNRVKELNEEIVNVILSKINDFFGIFNQCANAVKISILHCLRCNEKLYNLFSEKAPKCRNDLEIFIENEKKKNEKKS